MLKDYERDVFMKRFRILWLVLTLLLIFVSATGCLEYYNDVIPPEFEENVADNELTDTDGSDYVHDDTDQDENAVPDIPPVIQEISPETSEDGTVLPEKEEIQPDVKLPEHKTEDKPELDETPKVEEPAVNEEQISIPSDSSFEVHFIDVGQADATLVLCDGKAMMIDGGNAADSSLIYSYLKNRDIKHLDYVIATHAHEDHIGGLSGALNFATVTNVFCPTTSYDSKVFESFLKNVNKNGVDIHVPSIGETFVFGSANVKILGVNSTLDTNNTSIVLKITYGETSFLFTGDAERDAEEVILEEGFDLKSTVLKVGHHGSSTSTTYPFLREIMPAYAVIACGKDNEYGHPHEEVLSKLRDADVEIYRTDEFGGIICKSDGKSVEFIHEGKPVQAPSEPEEPTVETPDENEELPTVTVPEASADFEYILNTNTRKFHEPTCRSVKQMSDKNKDIFLGTRDELISKGYSPCGNCNP